jgi:Family of unknown function (DUF6101)
MLTVIPPAGTGSPCAIDLDAGPAVAGRIDFSGRIAGLPDRLIGADGARPAGVALRLDERAQDDDSFQLALVDECGGTLMVLGRFDEDEVVAAWRMVGAATGFPLITQSEDGAVQRPYPQVGRVQLGRVRIRRRHGLARRPRFLTRRKAARLPRRPIIYREREISGDGCI